MTVLPIEPTLWKRCPRNCQPGEYCVCAEERIPLPEDTPPPLRPCPWGCAPKMRRVQVDPADPRFPGRLRLVVECRHVLLRGEDTHYLDRAHVAAAAMRWNSGDMAYGWTPPEPEPTPPLRSPEVQEALNLIADLEEEQKFHTYAGWLRAGAPSSENLEEEFEYPAREVDLILRVRRLISDRAS